MYAPEGHTRVCPILFFCETHLMVGPLSASIRDRNVCVKPTNVLSNTSAGIKTRTQVSERSARGNYRNSAVFSMFVVFCDGSTHQQREYSKAQINCPCMTRFIRSQPRASNCKIQKTFDRKYNHC